MDAATALHDSDLARSLAAAVNPETIREQHAELIDLRREKARLLSDNGRLAQRVTRLEHQAKTQAALTLAVVRWFLADRDYLVLDLDGHKPALVTTLLDHMDEGDTDAANLLSLGIVAAAHTETYPHYLCTRCREEDCRGHGDDSEPEIRIPRAIRNLLAEVRRG